MTYREVFPCKQADLHVSFFLEGVSKREKVEVIINSLERKENGVFLFGGFIIVSEKFNGKKVNGVFSIINRQGNMEIEL